MGIRNVAFVCKRKWKIASKPGTSQFEGVGNSAGETKIAKVKQQNQNMVDFLVLISKNTS